MARIFVSELHIHNL